MVQGRVPPTLGRIHWRRFNSIIHGFVLLVFVVHQTRVRLFVNNMSAFIFIGRVLNVEIQVWMSSTHVSLDSAEWHFHFRWKGVPPQEEKQ